MTDARGARACRGSGRSLSVAARTRAAAEGLHRCPVCGRPQPVAALALAPHGR